MPSKTEKQARFMRMCAHDEGREWARKHNVKCPLKKVARDFVDVDKKLKHKKKYKDYLNGK